MAIGYRFVELGTAIYSHGVVWVLLAMMVWIMRQFLLGESILMIMMTMMESIVGLSFISAFAP